MFELKNADGSTHTIQILIINKRKHNFTSVILYCFFTTTEHVSMLLINRQVCYVVPIPIYIIINCGIRGYGEKRQKFVCTNGENSCVITKIISWMKVHRVL